MLSKSRILYNLISNGCKNIRFFSIPLPNEDICIQVSETDKIIGSVGKMECHKQPLSLHRAFSVFLFDENKKLLLQKRSQKKVTFPGVWSNTCCSHPLYNDKEINENGNIGVKLAASRRMGQELGLWNINENNFEVAGKFLYKAVMDDVWGEYELDYSLLLKCFNGTHLCNINKNEVDEIKLVNYNELQDMIRNGEPFSPWFLLFNNQGYVKKWFDDLDTNTISTNPNTIYKL
uniref:isopentenyl-diphosphate Delta-isomerase n=1 Tax=Parastrongyloides trichosuri TaxID=131310 RepID=A0A0N4ZFD2_PARTI